MINENGEMILKINFDGLGGFEVIPDESAYGWWVSEKDFHKYITARTMLIVTTNQLLSMRPQP